MGVRIGAVLAVVALLVLAPTAGAATFTVTNTNDSGVGSLRQAILDANATSGTDTIAFNIPGVAPFTIQPLSSLPFVSDPVVIDGTTQPGYSGSPVVELNGSAAGPSSPGLVILGGSSTIRGLVINNFDGAGVHMQQGGGNLVAGNYIGTDVTGTVAAGNRFIGVDIFGADDNVIGGTSAADRNLISGNVSNGVEIRSGAAEGIAMRNAVLGNFIGTDVTGTVALGNSGGVIVGGDTNTIGGTSAGARNVIAGNLSDGMIVGGFANVVQGNYIGVNVSGVTPLGNLNGVEVNGGDDNVIGGTTPGAGNVISGNRQEGLQITGSIGPATGNRVEGNFIGTDATGTVALGNGPGFRGVAVSNDATDNTIGGTTTAARNVISGNGIGVLIIASNAAGNRVQGNYIGTDVSGTAALPNRYGVVITFAVENTIGGTAPGAGNLISGNQFIGVQLNGNAFGGFADRNVVQGNLIGTDATGSAALPNSEGVVIDGSDNTIGGAADGAGNTIAHNGIGVFVQSGTGNAIHRNSVYSHGNLGIDLSPFGVTPNDSGDPDTGANDLQNFPVLTSASQSGGNTTIQGTLNSQASTAYRLEFFGNVICDPSGFGEGETFLGSGNVTTDPTGNASFSFTFPSAGGTFITATATDPTGNTSEFSACTLAGPPPPGGEVLNHFTCYSVVETPAVDVRVDLTDQFGTHSRRVRHADFLCNPVTKEIGGEVTPPVNQDAHLKCYRIVPPEQPKPTRRVEIRNQLTPAGQVIQANSTRYVCAPATKDRPDLDPAQLNLDHFTCYSAVGASVKKRALLSDQFLSSQNVQISKAQLLCNPTEKRRNDRPGEVVTPQFPDRHLVCYRVGPNPNVNRTVFTEDQFRVENTTALVLKYLCVPSEKRPV